MGNTSSAYDTTYDWKWSLRGNRWKCWFNQVTFISNVIWNTCPSRISKTTFSARDDRMLLFVINGIERLVDNADAESSSAEQMLRFYFEYGYLIDSRNGMHIQIERIVIISLTFYIIEYSIFFFSILSANIRRQQSTIDVVFCQHVHSSIGIR